MNTIDKIFKYLGLTSVFMAFGFVVYIFVSLNVDPKILDVKQPMKVDKLVYKKGETLTYEIDYCKDKNYQVLSFQRGLVDGYAYRLPDNTNNTILPLGCGKRKIEVPLTVPNTVSTDHKYKIVVTITYQINFLKTKVLQFETEQFYLKK